MSTGTYLGNPHDDPIWQEIADELDRAQKQHGPMASGHEAQSVIAEEVHEFTLAVWFGVDQKGRPADPREEAIQIAAMAVRYLIDVAESREEGTLPTPADLRGLYPPGSIDRGRKP